MADTNLDAAWFQIIENRTNRKLVFQTLLSIFKQALEKKSDDVINKTISHQEIKKVLDEIYSIRFGVLCNETFSFLYQICKIALKSGNELLKFHILELIPSLIALYYYNNSDPKTRGNVSTEGLEVLLNEITLLNGQNKEGDEGDDVAKLTEVIEAFPAFSKINELAKQNPTNWKQDKDSNQPAALDITIANAIQTFNTYISSLSEVIIEQYITLCSMISGAKTSILEFKVSNPNENPSDNYFSYVFPVHEIILKACISGLSTVRCVTNKYEPSVNKAIENLSKKALNTGYFKAYLYGETNQKSKLEDVFE